MFDNKCSCLCAIFDLGAMVREYDLKVMAEPAMHASAAKEILESERLLLGLLSGRNVTKPCVSLIEKQTCRCG